MHHTDQTGKWSTWGIFLDRAKGSSDRGARAAHPNGLLLVVGQDARRDLAAAELPDVLAAGWSDELAVGLRVEAMAEAPAH